MRDPLDDPRSRIMVQSMYGLVAPVASPGMAAEDWSVRALSFGAIAEDYDRFRSGPPARWSSGFVPTIVTERFRDAACVPVKAQQRPHRACALFAKLPGRRAPEQHPGLRPLERRLLRWRDQGASPGELADRFRRGPAHIERVLALTDYKLQHSAGNPGE
jgi:hypothetical protein